jgi:hypothetical protein
LYAYLFLDDFVLLYPVYTLLFSATGLSVWQIASLFVIWSLSSMAFEVPSGAWADATSRRLSSHDDRSGWTDALRSGLGEARRSPKIMVAVILVAVVASVWGALDEYTPLLIGSIGVDTVDVSLLMVVIWAGAATGGLLAGRAARLGTRSLAWLLCCGAALMTTGALSDHPARVVPLAAAFGVFQLVTVVADARLQDSISGPAKGDGHVARWDVDRRSDVGCVRQLCGAGRNRRPRRRVRDSDAALRIGRGHTRDE